jgi:hypothetical protein
MAQIFPEKPPMALPKATLKTFEALKQLPNAYLIWHHLAPWAPEAPDFLIISVENQALLIKVSSSTDVEVTQAAQLLLIGDERPELGEKEAAVLRDFIKSLGDSLVIPLGTLVVFPFIPQHSLQQSQPEKEFGAPDWAGMEILQPGSDVSWEMFFPEKTLDRGSLQKIRRQFTPEVIVPAEMTSSLPRSHRIEAGLTDSLLDYDQETVLKKDLNLDPDSRHLTSDFCLNIINGVAGSGKSLILLYRLRLLSHLYPEKKFLVLTHNKPLIKDLESRFFRVEGRLPENIAWHTFYSWCYLLWPENPPWVMPISQKTREAVIRETRESMLHDSFITERMLRGEIDWIKDLNLTSEAQYLEADRRGRGFGLTADQRGQVWDALEYYQAALQRLGAPDWGGIPQMLWHFLEEGAINVSEYDFILIDEAQFFAPVWIDLIKRALRSKASHLFMVADPTQGFLGRKATWKSMGIEARGRSCQLDKSYRTTLEIMQFATMFYRLRLPDEEDEDILAPNILDMPRGMFPQIIPLRSAQDEIARVANEVAAFLKQGVHKKDIYVLHANWQGAAALIQAINQRMGRNTAMEPKTTYPGNFVRVTTLSAGPGLESPIVFLVGLRTLFEEEQSLRLSDDEREELIETNTKKVFMAATRAGQRLVFTYVGDLPDVLKMMFTRDSILDT